MIPTPSAFPRRLSLSASLSPASFWWWLWLLPFSSWSPADVEGRRTQPPDLPFTQVLTPTRPTATRRRAHEDGTMGQFRQKEEEKGVKEKNVGHGNAYEKELKRVLAEGKIFLVLWHGSFPFQLYLWSVIDILNIVFLFIDSTLFIWIG